MRYRIVPSTNCHKLETSSSFHFSRWERSMDILSLPSVCIAYFRANENWSRKTMHWNMCYAHPYSDCVPCQLECYMVNHKRQHDDDGNSDWIVYWMHRFNVIHDRVSDRCRCHLSMQVILDEFHRISHMEFFIELCVMKMTDTKWTRDTSQHQCIALDRNKDSS
jgi:hypothetical protein